MIRTVSENDAERLVEICEKNWIAAHRSGKSD